MAYKTTALTAFVSLFVEITPLLITNANKQVKLLCTYTQQMFSHFRAAAAMLSLVFCKLRAGGAEDDDVDDEDAVVCLVPTTSGLVFVIEAFLKQTNERKTSQNKTKQTSNAAAVSYLTTTKQTYLTTTNQTSLAMGSFRCEMNAHKQAKKRFIDDNSAKKFAPHVWSAPKTRRRRRAQKTQKRQQNYYDEWDESVRMIKSVLISSGRTAANSTEALNERRHGTNDAHLSE